MGYPGLAHARQMPSLLCNASLLPFLQVHLFTSFPLLLFFTRPFIGSQAEGRALPFMSYFENLGKEEMGRGTGEA